MTIALIVLITIVVFAAGYLLWKSRDTWRWFHLTASAITLILVGSLSSVSSEATEAGAPPREHSAPHGPPPRGDSPPR